MALNALVVGYDDSSMKEVVKHLRSQNVHFLTHTLEQDSDFNAPTPACYIGQYRAYGKEDIIKKAKIYYDITKRRN